MKDPYEPVRRLPHPRSKRHRPMTLAERAAQFAPFSTLSGMGEMIKEAGQVWEKRPELSEDRQEMLEMALQQLRANPHRGRQVVIEFFQPDKSEDLGRRIICRGHFLALTHRQLILMEGEEIPMVDLVALWVEEEG